MYALANARSFFNNYSEPDFARAGFVATETVVLPKGAVAQFSFSQEPYLRTQLMMPTALERGTVVLVQDFTVCQQGVALQPNQARILKLIGNKMATMTFRVRCSWSNGEFEAYEDAPDKGEE